MITEKEHIIIRFLRYKKNWIIPLIIIFAILGIIINWFSINYFLFDLTPNIWNWGFKPIIWWKAILSFFGCFYIIMMPLIILLWSVIIPYKLFQLKIEDLEKIHYQKYLKTIHYPYPQLYLFLSHKSENKDEVLRVKNKLEEYGIKCFVAHENIEPTLEWENEIIQALRQMDMLVAFMSNDFKKSDWTSQEIGFALGKDVPILSINNGTAPYGFIGRTQAISFTNWVDIPSKIIHILFKNYSNYEKVIDLYLLDMCKCSSFDKANKLATYLPYFNKIKEQQLKQMIECFNKNEQLSGSYGFIGSEDYEGLVFHINRILNRDKYVYNKKTYKIEEK